MAVEPRKSVRIVSFNSKNTQHLRTVNIVTAQQSGGAANHKYPERLQLTAAQAQVQHHPTLMDSGGTTKGLPTIFVSGYTAPN